MSRNSLSRKLKQEEKNSSICINSVGFRNSQARAPVLLTQQETPSVQYRNPELSVLNQKEQIFKTYSEPNEIKFIRKKSKEKPSKLSIQFDRKGTESIQTIGLSKQSFKVEDECKSAGLKQNSMRKKPNFKINLGSMGLKPSNSQPTQSLINVKKVNTEEKKLVRLGSFSDQGERPRKHLESFSQLTPKSKNAVINYEQ